MAEIKNLPEEVVTRQVAALAASGASRTVIASQLGLSLYKVKAVMASDEFKQLVTDIGDEATRTAKQQIKASVGNLATEVARVLKEQLQENNLEAVKIALKVMGFDQAEEQKGDTNIQVILPGQEKNVIEGEFRAIETESDKDAK